MENCLISGGVSIFEARDASSAKGGSTFVIVIVRLDASLDAASLLIWVQLKMFVSQRLARIFSARETQHSRYSLRSNDHPFHIVCVI
jgi:hypothetical protein